MIKIKEINDIFKRFSEENNYIFNDNCVGAGYDYQTFIDISAVPSERLLYSLQEVGNSNTYENSSSSIIVQKWNIYPVIRDSTTPAKMANKLTEIYFKLKTYFENTSFIIDNKTSLFDTMTVEGEMQSGIALLNGSSNAKEEYNYLLEITIRK